MVRSWVWRSLLVICSASAMWGQSLGVTSSSLRFPEVANYAPYGPQYFTLFATNGTTVPFTFAVSTASGGSWLSVQPTQNTTTTPVQVNVNTTALAPATYSGTITFTATGLTPVSVNVQLTVFAFPPVGTNTFALSTNSVAFSYVVGGTSPAQMITFAAATPLVYTTTPITGSGGNWLNVFGNTSEPRTTALLLLSANPAGLSVGIYRAVVQVTAGGVTQSIDVTLTVTSSSPGFSLTSAAIALSYEQQGTSPSQVLGFLASPAMEFSATAVTTSGGNWLSVSPDAGGPTTNTNILVSANPSGLPVGVYLGIVRITASGTTRTIPVTLTVPGPPENLIVSPRYIELITSSGGTGISRTVSLASTSALSFSATTDSSWLTVTPTSGSAPASLTITATPGGLSPGTYKGNVRVTAGDVVRTIPVTLSVTAAPSGAVTASPNAPLIFTYAIGGSTPMGSSLTIESPGSVPFTISPATVNGLDWFSVTPASGSLNNTRQLLSVSVNPIGLPAGSYAGAVQVFTSGQLAATLPVSLLITGTAAAITVWPVSTQINVPPGTSSIQQQTFTLAPATGVSYSATASSTGGWLTVSPNQGSVASNTTLTVWANPTGLAVGTHIGSISIVVPGQQVITVPVTLVVASLAVTPSALSFSLVQYGALPANQSLQITTPTYTVYRASSSGVAGNTTWLATGPNSGATMVPATGQLATATEVVGVVNNQLPPGVYNGSVIITATGLAAVTVPVTVTVTSGPLSIQPGGLPSGTLGQSYGLNLTALAGSGSGRTWSVIDGTLPTGLTLNPSTGSIAGVPTAAGTFPFTIKVTDSAGGSATMAYSVNVVDAFRFSTTRLPGGVTNTGYRASLQVINGTPPYTILHRGLPDELTLNSTTGEVSGTPTIAGTYYPSVTVRDSMNRTLNGNLTLVIQRAPTKLSYVPVTPCRIMETRAEYNYQGRTGAFGPPFLATNETRTLTLPASNVCQIPTNARAFVLNVTLLPRAPVDFVTVYPGDEPRPDYWTVRSPDGEVVANSAIVRAGTGGTLRVYTSDSANVLIDVSGYFTETPNLVFYPTTPCRAVETRIDYRSPAGPFGPPTLNTAETRRFRLPASPHCTIPSTAAAYSATVTVVPPGPLAYLTAWPTGSGQPNVSSINSFAGRVLANNLIIPAGIDGAIDVFAYDRTDLIVDINGSFAPDDGVNGLYYYPLVQCRLTDSAGDEYNDETTRTLAVRDSQACVSIPTTAKAYALNFTALPNGSPMPFLTAYPTGQPRPNASILNAFQGQIISNSALIPTAANGAIDIFAFRRTRVVVEINGYFAR